MFCHQIGEGVSVTRICVTLISGVLLFISCGTSSDADLVLRGGKIATVDETFSFHQAVAVRGDQIIFVGSDADVKSLIGPQTRIIELDGRLVTPGMVDAHGHPFNLGNTDEEEWFSVGGTKDWDEVVGRVAAKVKTIEPGEWIILINSGRLQVTKTSQQQFIRWSATRSHLMPWPKSSSCWIDRPM